MKYLSFKSSPDDNAPMASSARGILLVVCVGMFFGVLNASAVGVVLPKIGEGLAIETAQVGWLMTGYLLVYGVSIPFYGRLADRYGEGHLFIFGVALFSVGSLLAALAANFEFLMVARVIQALGGAAVPGLGMALVARAYSPESRGRVLGIIAAVIAWGPQPDHYWVGCCQNCLVGVPYFLSQRPQC